MTIQIDNPYQFILYLIILAAYCYVGLAGFAMGVLSTMDTGMNFGTVIFLLGWSAAWVAGLIYGTQSYFN